jgi:hypothetical protein
MMPMRSQSSPQQAGPLDANRAVRRKNEAIGRARAEALNFKSQTQNLREAVVVVWDLEFRI